MKIDTMDSFLKYYERTRKITERVIQAIPHDQIDWTYKSGKFTIGDILRHIAAIERNVFVEVALGKPSTYTGCGKDLADGFYDIITYVNSMHKQSVGLLSTIPDGRLSKQITTLNGRQTTLANFLSALVVHEIHHRGALCIYLNMLDVQTPPILGFTEQEVIKVSK